MRFIILMLALLASAGSFAQKKGTPPQPQKKPLDHTVYDNWKEIPYKALTPDGAFAAFIVTPQDGDGKVIFYNLKTNAQDSVKRAADIALSFDSKYAIFKIKPQQNLVKELRRQKKKKEDLPKDSLGIYSFANRKLQKVADVKSFKIPEKAGGWVAYQQDEKKESKPTTAAGDKKPAPKKKKVNSDENGFTLVLKKLSADKEVSFGYVKDYSFAKYGQGLLFSSTGNDSTLQAGVYWYDLQKEQLTPLYQGNAKYKYKGLSISEDGTQTAFLLDADTSKALIRQFKLYHWSKDKACAQLLDVETSMGIPQNWIVSEHYVPLFSKDGNKLFFGSAPKPVVQDTTLLTEEIVNVEI
ncbi:MAG: S9 family peptidase, partial [Cyclobacteriaceae bacterium]|nr:S9 family peptidase [Cyclobacteriaceae bacterium]